MKEEGRERTGEGGGRGLGTWEPAGLEHVARRGDNPHALHKIVDVGEMGRKVPRPARGDPAPGSRKLEGLWVVPQRQPVRLERGLERRTVDPALDLDMPAAVWGRGGSNPMTMMSMVAAFL